jgi:N-acetylneuraminate synthase
MIKIIAEIGINHNGSLEYCKKLIDLCAVSLGCNYVKIQKRNPCLSVPDAQKNKIKKTPWGEMTYLEYKNKIELTEDQVKFLINYSKEKKIIFFASVWDLFSAKLMSKLNNKITKIPSALIKNLELCKFARDNFETLIISTGMSNEKEIEKCIKTCNPDVILHTNSTYPCPVEDLNMNYIKWLIKKWPSKQIGYSGHESGLATTFAAATIGCDWIERHITLDKNEWGSDQSSSLEPLDFLSLVKGIRDIESSFRHKEGPRKLSKKEEIKKKTLRG